MLVAAAVVSGAPLVATEPCLVQRRSSLPLRIFRRLSLLALRLIPEPARHTIGNILWLLVAYRLPWAPNLILCCLSLAPRLFPITLLLPS